MSAIRKKQYLPLCLLNMLFFLMMLFLILVGKDLRVQPPNTPCAQAYLLLPVFPFQMCCGPAWGIPLTKLCHKEANEVPPEQPPWGCSHQQIRPASPCAKCGAQAEDRNIPASEIVHPVLIKSKGTDEKWLLIFLILCLIV